MDIVKELKNLKKEESVIIRIKRSAFPLLIWGCGDFAVEVAAYLESKGVQIEDAFVDEAYYVEGTLFRDRPVLSVKEVIEKYGKVDIIIGCSSYEKRHELEARQYVNQAFYLFSVNYGVFDVLPLSIIEDNIASFERVYELLEDQKSKDNFLAFLKTRITGKNEYIEELFSCAYTFYDNEIFTISDDEVFVDVGAYDGDTIRLFLDQNCRKYKYIYAIEADKNCYQRLNDYIENNSLDRIETTDIGVWNQKGSVSFDLNDEQLGSVVEGNANGKDTIKVDLLDKLFEYKYRVTLLKLNYKEGVKEAIEGASNILLSHSPKLALTVGFDFNNIIALPLLIKSINPKYKLYLRFNRAMVSALTLYGIVEE